MSIEVLRRDEWHSEPKDLGEPADEERPICAAATRGTHVFGWDLQLQIDGRECRRKVGRNWTCSPGFWRLFGIFRSGHADSPPDDCKPCTFSGCRGVMMFEDRAWASYSTWVCKWNPEHQELVYKEGNPKKFCSVAGCHGMMHFHSRRVEEPGEWPWYASWVCARDSSHFEVIPEGEDRQIMRELNRRRRR
jgi:hypothetical protein